MTSRGPLALLTIASGILALGIIAHSPDLFPAIQPIARTKWAFPVFCSLLAAAAILLARAWHRSLVRAKRDGEAFRDREFRQRSLAQQRLIERQQWHQSMFEQNQLAMLLIDPISGNIIDANAAACAFYGYLRDAMLAKRLFDINVLPDEVVKQRMQQVVNEGTTRFSAPHRSADGTIREVTITSGPLLTGGRQLLFSIVQDISPQLQAEESIRRIVEASPLGFHMYRLEGEQLIFTGYNQAADKILRCSHAPMIGREIGEIFSKTALASAASRYREIARHGGQWVIENFHYIDERIDGIFEVHAFQSAPGQVVAMFADATERYRQEELLARSERRFRLLYERSPFGIATVDLLSQQIINANSAFQRILGVDEPGLQHRSFNALPDANGDEPPQITANAFVGEYPQTFYRQYRRHDGSPIWVELTLCSIPGDEGASQIGLAIIQDITQRRQGEELLRDAKQVAERANAAKDQFLAALSHELRTPLTPVLLTTQSLLTDNALPEASREDLAMIQRNVELEARLIDDLLDLTRIARGKLQLHTGQMNLHECIRHAVEICQPDAQQKGIRLEVWLEAERNLVLADASRMQQVFWNLIKNAIKFTPQRGLVVVRTHNDRPAQTPADCPEIICEVVDNGLGMDAETRARVFTPFEQGSAQITKLFGGLGMGLAITKAIVELHHGRIDAFSDGPGTGSIFTVAFKTLASPTSPAEPDRVPQRQSGNPLMTVLLVEDHEATAKAMSRLLIRCGYKVINAVDVASAMQAASEHHFDLLISDLGLPDGSGNELVARIKQMRPVPAIAVSGYGMEQDIRNSLAAGFQEHLIKPINAERLQQAIARVISPVAS